MHLSDLKENGRRCSRRALLLLCRPCFTLLWEKQFNVERWHDNRTAADLPNPLLQTPWPAQVVGTLEFAWELLEEGRSVRSQVM